MADGWQLEGKRGTNRLDRTCEVCGKAFTEYASRVRKGLGRYCSKGCFDDARRGKPNVQASIERIPCPCQACGKIVMRLPCHTYRKFCSKSCYGKSIRGENHPQWIDGESLHGDYRNDTAYKRWRSTVFVRDDYTCQDCFQHGGYLNAHHVKPWKTHPELRFAVENGVTLCAPCHRRRHQ